MSLRARFVRIFWKWVAPLAGLAALALAVFVYFHSPRERTYRFRLTAGNATGTRHHLARLLQAELTPRNLLLELDETPGSEEALSAPIPWRSRRSPTGSSRRCPPSRSRRWGRGCCWWPTRT